MKPCVEVIRMVLPSGKILSEHKAPGEIIVQCLEGEITFTTTGDPRKLRAGDVLYLAAGEPHALEAPYVRSKLKQELPNDCLDISAGICARRRIHDCQ